METDPTSANDGLDPIRGLLGSWRGHGQVVFRGETFHYAEEMTFELGGGRADFPFVAFAQRAWDEDSGETMHMERGMWRVHEGGTVDVTLAHPIGVTEIAEGTVRGGAIRLTSVRIQVGERGLPVTSLRRDYDLDHEELRYHIQLATGDIPLFEHLVGTLRRASA
ncbi:MAG: FABP family protein [Actinomycetota bacterium]